MSFLDQPLSLISISPRRKWGDILVTVVTNESSADTLEITKHPVQRGATISDHAYKNPVTLSVQAYFKDNAISAITSLFSFGGASPLEVIYQSLLKLQSDLIPFDVITPKRIYKNMLFQALGQTTDKNTNACLAINATFQEVIIVDISTSVIPRLSQKNAGRTGATEAAGNKSALLVLKEGVGKVFGR